MVKKKDIILTSIFCVSIFLVNAQTSQDSLEIRQVALDYIESQHHLKPEQFERAAHPRMVKRTFWTNKKTQKEYLGETFRDAMILLAETPIRMVINFLIILRKRLLYWMFTIKLLL